MFFFSSRRRHTRSKRDWSSDVCSSDLEPKSPPLSSPANPPPPRAPSSMVRLELNPCSTTSVEYFSTRSEERRVGKECRSRWSRGTQEKHGKGERLTGAGGVTGGCRCRT